MKIRFDEIPEEGLRLIITDPSWFPDDEIREATSVQASVVLERKGADRVLLGGSLAAGISLNCDRCLESFHLPLDVGFEINFELSDRHSMVKEHCCHSNEMDTVVLSEPMIDVLQVLQQQALLAIPMKKLCSEGCLGLCPRCGKNLNQDRCNCSETSASTPFDILKNLKG